MSAVRSDRPASAANPVAELRNLGQSVWLDFLSRGLVRGPELRRLIDEDGLAGMTSNPTIFEKAISGGDEYRESLSKLRSQSATDPKGVYERLAIEDIRSACDVFAPVYRSTSRGDGYVSLEVSPTLAYDTRGTLEEARRLWREVARENLMIKVPATPAGVPAIQTLLSEGINVNITLLFAVEAYQQVASAHMAGLETWTAGGGDPARVASVASFFVSRVDTACDALLDERAKLAKDPRERELARDLRGKIAIANAKLAYKTYLDWIATPRWKALARKGVRPQRLLWASTGTKDPSYSDVMYVEELIGPDTVDTIPQATLEAFRDHGKPRPSLGEDLEAWIARLDDLARLGIDLQGVCSKLLSDGVKQFEVPFAKLLAAIAASAK